MNHARNGHSVTSPLLGHISKTGSGPLAGARDCEIMAEQSDFEKKKSKDRLGSFIAVLPPRHEVSWAACDRERSSCNEPGGISFFFFMFCLNSGCRKCGPLPHRSSGGESWP